jgi:hypothetical protein
VQGVLKHAVTLKLFPVKAGEKPGLKVLSKDPPFKKTAPIDMSIEEIFFSA